MRAATVEDVAQEFMRILAEGWSPDPEEFLHRVPEDLREDCRARLEELIRERDGDRPEESEAVEEAVETFEGAKDEVIVFELGDEGTIESVKVPSIDVEEEDEPVEAEAAPEEIVEEPEQDEAADLVEASMAAAVEAALQPEEPEVVEQPEVVVDLEEAETADVAQPPTPEPQAEIENAETAEIPEPIVEQEPLLEEEPVVEPEPVVEEPVVEEPVAEEPKPEGLVKLSREEAKAMFEAMERNRK